MSEGGRGCVDKFCPFYSEGVKVAGGVLVIVVLDNERA